MASTNYQSFVPADSKIKELSLKALILGIVMAVILGAANAYLGMKAGLTVSATFPAAVVAIAVLRIFRGNILEENIARTTASVGEALAAGAIFTIPAFILSGVWSEFHYWESTLIMLIGGLLGILFVIILRRSLITEAGLPYPESVAAAEIVKAGQGGQSGASYVFSSMGIAAVWELFKNSNGIQMIKGFVRDFIPLPASKITLLGKEYNLTGGFLFETPAAYPALVGVGFIVGLRISTVLFTGAVLGWLFLIPAFIFLNPALPEVIREGESWIDLSMDVWFNQVRPLAVGTMIVAAFYTLFNLRSALVLGIKKAMSDISAARKGMNEVNRLELDIDFSKIFLTIALLSIPLFILYYYFSGSLPGSIILTLVMIILGFLFSAVAGYLVGVVGGSNNPISGLTLSSLIIAAIILVSIGVTGTNGTLAVLAVAGIVCCAAGVAGDMLQDLKVGHILGGTPWKMEIAEIIGLIASSLVLIWAMVLLHQVYHIGSEELPAPQAGLMSLLAKGIMGGAMSWTLVVAGMFLGIGLIMIKAPSPMVIAVGMYLPFHSTFSIFVGGLIKWAHDFYMQRKKVSEKQKVKAENIGILISSGLIAGEALMAIILGFVFLGIKYFESPFSLTDLAFIKPNFLIGFLSFIGLSYLLINIPFNKVKKQIN
jgi:putative OPT family oligopeptide transporter